MSVHAYAQDAEQAQPEPQSKVVCTDIVGHAYGLVKVVGSQAAMYLAVFGEVAPDGALMLLAFQQNGEHVPIHVRQSSILLIGRESEEPIYAAPDPATPTGTPDGIDGDVLEVGG